MWRSLICMLLTKFLLYVTTKHTKALYSHTLGFRKEILSHLIIQYQFPVFSFSEFLNVFFFFFNMQNLIMLSYVYEMCVLNVYKHLKFNLDTFPPY